MTYLSNIVDHIAEHKRRYFGSDGQQKSNNQAANIPFHCKKLPSLHAFYSAKEPVKTLLCCTSQGKIGGIVTSLVLKYC